jgi:hypothetical protein
MHTTGDNGITKDVDGDDITVQTTSFTAYLLLLVYFS